MSTPNPGNVQNIMWLNSFFFEVTKLFISLFNNDLDRFRIFFFLRFLTVFLCLFLSVVATMPEYESIASTVLLQTVNLAFSESNQPIKDKLLTDILILFCFLGDHSGNLVSNGVSDACLECWLSFTLPNIYGSSSFYEETILCSWFVLHNFLRLNH